MTADIDIKKVDKEVKVVLVGESGVGKSSIALRFVNNNFKTITASTIGASFVVCISSLCCIVSFP